MKRKRLPEADAFVPENGIIFPYGSGRGTTLSQVAGGSLSRSSRLTLDKPIFSCKPSYQKTSPWQVLNNRLTNEPIRRRGQRTFVKNTERGRSVALLVSNNVEGNHQFLCLYFTLPSSPLYREPARQVSLFSSIATSDLSYSGLDAQEQRTNILPLSLSVAVP